MESQCNAATTRGPQCKNKAASGLDVCHVHNTTASVGHLYVLSNPGMPGLVKVGKTTRTAAARAAELSSGTGVPDAFVVEFESDKCADVSAAEKRAHTVLADLRTNQRREFFKCPVADAIQAAKDAISPAGVHVVEIPEGTTELVLRFSKVGI